MLVLVLEIETKNSPHNIMSQARSDLTIHLLLPGTFFFFFLLNILRKPLVFRCYRFFIAYIQNIIIIIFQY